MLRAVLIAATFFASGCPSHATAEHPQPIVDDTALRIRIARAEVKRAGGIAELTELATKGDAHAKALGLRGLGRIGGDAPIKRLLEAITDPDPDVATAAYAAIGVAASLDDTSPLVGQAIPSLSDDHLRAVIEAFGRAAGTKEQALIAVAVRDKSPVIVAEAALAFARMARRKIAFEPVARDWLAAKTKDPDRGVRYAATYALAREFQPPASPSVIAALAARVVDDDAETRSSAIAALAKRDGVAAAMAAISESLRDRDWRVAVEAVRALGGKSASPTQRDLLATNLERRWTELAGAHGPEAQVISETLRTIIAHPELTPVGSGALAEFSGKAIGGGLPTLDGVSPLAGSWIAFEAGVAATALSNSVFPGLFSDGALPQHLRFTLAEDAFPHGDTAFQRAIMRAMLESPDPRERADGLGILGNASTAFDRAMVVSTLAAAVGSKDPVISGAAADAIGAFYKSYGTDPTLDAAIVARAAVETEPELASGLYETIGTYKVAAGATACRAALAHHPIAARAGAACLKALGQAVPDPEIGIAEPPPGIDVATVIGKHVTWHVFTTTGEISIELRPDIAPWNVATIVELTRRGFYNNIEFHRVVPDFVVQGGDPTMSGVGGPGFTTPAEPATVLDGPGFITGGIGIADAGRDSGGSQWFAMHSRAPHLDGRYTYIGQIVAGQSFADSLLIGDRVVRATVDVK